MILVEVGYIIQDKHILSNLQFFPDEEFEDFINAKHVVKINDNEYYIIADCTVYYRKLTKEEAIELINNAS